METKTLTLGSLFDGSGAFPLGSMMAGIEPVFSCEIEPFPILVTHKRLPSVKHYGDVSTLNGAELPPVDIITFGSPCFPEGTLVLTEEGYLPIEEVEVGMKVLTHTGTWKKVTATGAKFGETVVLKGNHYGLECTPNHPIYSSGERKYYPQLGNGKRGNQILLTDEKTWIPAGEMKGRLWAVPNVAEALPISSPVYSGSWREKTMPPLSEDLFYFIGRWLGDGWVRNTQRCGRPEGQRYGTVYICDSLDKEDELRTIIEKITDSYHVMHERTVVKFAFTSQVLCEWLTDNFGQYACGKTMPGWVFGLPEVYRQSLLEGILDSDGWHVKDKENTWKVSTVSKKLAESIRLLSEIQGYSTTVHKTEVEKEKLIEGRLVRQRDWYSVVITKNGRRGHLKDDLHGWYRVRDVQPTNHTKVVYNLTVEEDNSYVADGIVVHNCQDLSIAGKRAGIHDGERSNLFFQAIRIIKEMREKTNGEYPRYCVWENVPGAFSSNGGDDFKAVLEAVIGVKEEGVEVPAPKDHRWPKADVYLGDGWSVAYRVLDAQYWGVPQRRARIYLVGDFAGGSAPEVLFKSEGLSRYTPQGIRSWERAAGGAEEGAGETGERSDHRGGDGRYCVNTQGNSGVGITEEQTLALVAQDHGNHPAVMQAIGNDGYNGAVTDDKASTLGVNCGMSTGRNGVIQAAGFSTEHSAKARSIGYEEEVSPTLRAGVVPAALMYDNHPQDCRYDGPLDESPTVTARYGTGGNNQPLVAMPDPITLKIRCGGGQGGKGALLQRNKSATLATNNDQTLFQPDIKAYGVCSKSSHAMLSDNPHSGFYEAKTSRTLDQGGGSPQCNQGGICICAPAPETYDVRFTSEGTKNARGHCYKTEIARCLDTAEANSDSNHGGIAVVEEQKAFALQGSMIGRADKNGPQGDGVNEEVSFTLTNADRHAVAAPTYCATTGSYMEVTEEKSSTLMARDYKDPKIINEAEDAAAEEPVYIVRRLTPVECARLQGFPDWWCMGLETPDPSDEELSFWTEVWDTWNKLNGKKPKTEKQIRKWLADPYTDAAEYKLWGNGCCAQNTFFVLAGIEWAVNKGEA